MPTQVFLGVGRFSAISVLTRAPPGKPQRTATQGKRNHYYGRLAGDCGDEATETAGTEVGVPLSAGFPWFFSCLLLVEKARVLVHRPRSSAIGDTAKINPDVHASISPCLPVCGDPRDGKGPPGHQHAQPHKRNEIIITGAWPGIARAKRRRLQPQRWTHQFKQDSADLSLVCCLMLQPVGWDGPACRCCHLCAWLPRK